MSIATSQYLADKKAACISQVQFHLERFTAQPRQDIGLYFIPLPEDVAAFQEHYALLNPEFYPEDYATFTVVLHCLQQAAAVTDPATADFLVLPFNLFFYPQCKEEIDEVMSTILAQYGHKRLLFCCISDFCMRPVRRSLPFERVCLEEYQAAEDEYFPAFVRPDDVIIHFESTVDLLGDIAIFPLIPVDIVTPDAGNRPYHFSFAGEYYKSGWPEGFVRSPSRKPIWEAMAARNQAHAFIGKGVSAHPGVENKFLTIPQQSVFSLCPRGIAAWSFRLFESVVKGAIPVIMADGYVKPFPEYLPWDMFSITLPESMLSDIDDILLRMRPQVTARLQQGVQQYQQQFTVNGLLSMILSRLSIIARPVTADKS